MEGLLQIVAVFKANGLVILSAVAHLVMFASIIVKLTPTLKDDAYLKPVVKFLGRWIAWDKYGPGGTTAPPAE